MKHYINISILGRQSMSQPQSNCLHKVLILALSTLSDKESIHV